MAALQCGVHISRVQATEQAGCFHDGNVRVRRSLEIARDSVDWTSEKERQLVRVLTFNGSTLAEVRIMSGNLPKGRASAVVATCRHAGIGVSLR